MDAINKLADRYINDRKRDINMKVTNSASTRSFQFNSCQQKIRLAVYDIIVYTSISFAYKTECLYWRRICSAARFKKQLV
jgi:hypothetical protein